VGRVPSNLRASVADGSRIPSGETFDYARRQQRTTLRPSGTARAARRPARIALY
jgi:hypothetical protein